MNLPLNIDIRQILLHMLNFVILFGGLYFILYKPVKDFILKREKMYEDIDLKTKNALKSAEDTKKDYEEKLKNADGEIQQMEDKAKENAELLANDIIKKAKAEADEILNKARTQAEYEAKESLHHANSEISKIAQAAAKKIVFKSTSESYDAFLDNAKGDAKGGK
ncbi:MAG: ATP synthase F0 subunit B [Clostridia bacterium]|nr:ATP synthase F0 subunit B [Clostridia bacterium]